MIGIISLIDVIVGNLSVTKFVIQRGLFSNSSFVVIFSFVITVSLNTFTGKLQPPLLYKCYNRYQLSSLQKPKNLNELILDL